MIKNDNLFIKNVEYFLIYIPKMNYYINYICIWVKKKGEMRSLLEKKLKEFI